MPKHRLLNRRCGPFSDATTAQIQALPLEQLEALAVDAAFSAGVALLDFTGPARLHRPGRPGHLAGRQRLT